MSPHAPMPRSAVQLAVRGGGARRSCRSAWPLAHVLLGDGYPVSFELSQRRSSPRSSRRRCWRWYCCRCCAASSAYRTRADGYPITANRPEPPPDKNQMMIRAATLGVIAVVLFGVLLFRLWALQVLHSDHYVAQANQNDVRQLPLPAPRGEIVDSTGEGAGQEHEPRAGRGEPGRAGDAGRLHHVPGRPAREVQRGCRGHAAGGGAALRGAARARPAAWCWRGWARCWA